jgi:predicted enzyme related to lactoylglutathione lyase
MMMNTMDGPNGGFAKDIDIHSKPGINIYLEVADIEQTIVKVEKAGGKCLVGKTQISLEYGYYAFIEDLEGNKIGLWARH